MKWMTLLKRENVTVAMESKEIEFLSTIPMSQGLPSAFRLGSSLPSGVPAYRQDTIHNSTTQNEFRPDQTVTIPLQTGTTGAFWNTATTRLLVNVQITNANPFADFDSFTRGGLAKLIRELAFRVNGVDVEVNRNYASVVELEMIRYGRNTDPYYMTFVNDWQVGGGVAGEMHINLVKPCMVNASGSPWNLHASNANSDPYFVARREQYLTSYRRPIFDAQTSATDNYDVQAINSVHSDAAIPILLNTTPTADYTSTVKPFTYASNIAALSESPDVHGWGPLCAAQTGSPLAWPYYQPYDPEKLAERVKANRSSRTPLPDVARYYANVKYLPIMATPTLNALTDYVGGGTKPSPILSALATGERQIEIHGCLELYLGTIGVLAKRAFPALAVGSGRAELAIRLETERRFFQLTMDPCRRVPGTVRDWAPYMGASNSTLDFVNGTTCASLGRYSGSEMLFHGQLRKKVGTDSTAHKTALESLSCLKDSVCIGRYPKAPNEFVCAGILKSTTGAVTVVSDSGDTTDTFFHGSNSAGKIVNSRQGLLTNIEGAKNLAVPRSHYCAPRPQYLPVEDPYGARNNDSGAGATGVSELGLCFGTYLSKSHPQSARVSASTRQTISSDYYTSEIPSFVARNFALIVDEILFSDSIVSGILAGAIAGNATIETKVLVETVIQLPKALSQNVLIPLTGASITDVCLAFQHPTELQGPDAHVYSASNFINPFTIVKKTSYTAHDVAYSAYGVSTSFVNSTDMGINMQFSIGSEQMPRRPINDLQVLSEFVSKGDQVFRGASDHGDYGHMSGHACQLDFHTDMGASTDAAFRTIPNALQPGFFAPHCPLEALGDQTITNNTYLYSTAPKTTIEIPRSKAGYVVPFKHTLEPLQATFHIPLNLETFMGQSDKIRSGTSIVNSQFFFKAEKMLACQEDALQMLAYARAHATLVFERGGGVQLIR